jgi:hypothetical protein
MEAAPYDRGTGVGGGCVARARALVHVCQTVQQALKDNNNNNHSDDNHAGLLLAFAAVRLYVPELQGTLWVPADGGRRRRLTDQRTDVAGCLLLCTPRFLTCVVGMHGADAGADAGAGADAVSLRACTTPDGADYAVCARIHSLVQACSLSACCRIDRMRMRRHIVFAGHGCAGAAAQLLALRYAGSAHCMAGTWPVREVYSFGAPKVGDRRFRMCVAAACIRHFRVALEEDDRPRLPETHGLVHTGELCVPPASPRDGTGHANAPDLLRQLQAAAQVGWRDMVQLVQAGLHRAVPPSFAPLHAYVARLGSVLRPTRPVSRHGAMVRPHSF